MAGLIWLWNQGAGGGSGTNPGTTNLKAWWALDETTDVTRVDSHSGTAYDLTPNNTPTYRTGVISNACDFVRTSSQHLSRAHETALCAHAGFAYAGWFYLDDTTNSQLAGSASTSASESSWRLTSETGIPRIAVSDGTDFNSLLDWTGSSIASGWHYVACGYILGTDTLWISVDGDTRATTTTGITVIEGTRAFNIGARPNATGAMDGGVDESCFFSSLTADDVIWLYNGGTGREYSDLGGGGGFQVAWAIGSNVVLQPGVSG